MEKIHIYSLPATIVASHRAVIPSYDELGKLCDMTIGPEMSTWDVSVLSPVTVIPSSTEDIGRKTQTSSTANRLQLHHDIHTWTAFGSGRTGELADNNSGPGRK